MAGGETQAQLPVFCVSARDCHRIEGRLPAESKKATFSVVKHTEVPDLRAHVHHLTGRAPCCSHLTLRIAGVACSMAQHKSAAQLDCSNAAGLHPDKLNLWRCITGVCSDCVSIAYWQPKGLQAWHQLICKCRARNTSSSGMSAPL